jgi:MoxR-like ATPase
MNLEMIASFRDRVKVNLEKVIIGKPEVLERVIMALVCRGHLLIEDIPGTGKTMLAKSLAISLGSGFRRIQFTPDMLPSDVTGLSIFNQQTKSFEFRPGPIMANIILADEINRATPKTQSALLEAMEERQVTVDGITHKLPSVFMVVATQNPIEYEGTFNLPEAQLDRFLIRIRIGYPDEQHEIQMLRSQQFSHPIESLHSVTDAKELMAVQEEIKQVHVSEHIEKYIVSINNTTRKNDDIYLGASPRGSLALYRLGQCTAAFKERDFVIPDDVKSIAPYVLAHRLIIQPSSRLQELESEEIIMELLEKVKVPSG